MPQELGLPEQDGASAVSPPLEEKTDNFFVSFFEPHFGHGVFSQRVERTKTSLSAPHFPQ
jgi:hypothetical protein